MTRQIVDDSTPDIKSNPSDFYVLVTPSATPLTNGPCRSINAETAGRVNLTQLDGTARVNYPLIAGYNPVCASVIDAPTTGTAATGIWALY